MVLGDVREDAAARRTNFRPFVAEPLGRVLAARIAIVSAILLEQSEFATAVGTRKARHATPRRPGAANKSSFMISKNEILHDLYRRFSRKPFYRKPPWARCATLAQPVEQPPCKRQVGSSILPGGFDSEPFRLFQKEPGRVPLPGHLSELDIEPSGNAGRLVAKAAKMCRLHAVLSAHLPNHELGVAADQIRATITVLPVEIVQVPQQINTTEDLGDVVGPKGAVRG